jgi:hypothetical protein
MKRLLILPLVHFLLAIVLSVLRTKGRIRSLFISEGQTTQWPKENEPKGESEAFHQQRTDNTMTKRK